MTLDTTGLGSATIYNQHQKEAVHRSSLASAVVAWPRRLGQDATAGELAKDKRVARRIVHASQQALYNWSIKFEKDTYPQRLPSEDERRQAATISWDLWVPSTIAHLESQRSLWVTYFFKAKKDLEGKRVNFLMQQEIDALARSLR